MTTAPAYSSNCEWGRHGLRDGRWRGNSNALAAARATYVYPLDKTPGRDYARFAVVLESAACQPLQTAKSYFSLFFASSAAIIAAHGPVRNLCSVSNPVCLRRPTSVIYSPLQPQSTRPLTSPERASAPPLRLSGPHLKSLPRRFLPAVPLLSPSPP